MCLQIRYSFPKTLDLNEIFSRGTYISGGFSFESFGIHFQFCYFIFEHFFWKLNALWLIFYSLESRKLSFQIKLLNLLLCIFICVHQLFFIFLIEQIIFFLYGRVLCVSQGLISNRIVLDIRNIEMASLRCASVNDSVWPFVFGIALNSPRMYMHMV